MNKRYITSYVFEKVSNPENGTTKAYKINIGDER